MNAESRPLQLAPTPAPAAPPSRAASAKPEVRPPWWLFAIVLLLGCALRIVPWTAFDGMGYDESWYRKYLLALDQHGLTAYPDLCAAYLANGTDEQAIATAPPTRALFVVAGWGWKRAFFRDAPPADLNTPEGFADDPARISLHRVATVFGCLWLLAAWGFAHRLLGPLRGLAVLALGACSPLLIHMSQHALVDGIFATFTLLTLWTLWESMQEEARPAWLAAYALSFIGIVLTKENAVFAAVGLTVIMAMGTRWGLGVADRRHWFVTIAAGVIALSLLTVAAGELPALFAIYQLLIGKVQTLGYAQATGDGAWSRYLVDLMIFTPATLCFAIGGGWRALGPQPRTRVLVVFIAATYVAMCHVRYGMNLRYTTIWMLPLCALAVAQAHALAVRFRHPHRVLAGIVAVLCAIDLAQYRQFFVKHRLYELPTADLLRAERMLK
jgi:hypothetical protein